ncbi:hypothetical protein [Massilia sp. PWRC2]|uniref:hypothetical protein n=1 Tax=Massilia sp. PWRC2 TaxID=2804626 RepID=UPI003CE6D52B
MYSADEVKRLSTEGAHGRASFVVWHQIAVLCGALPAWISLNQWTYPLPLIVVFLPILMILHPSIRAQSGRLDTCFLSIAIGLFPGGALSGVLWFVYSMGTADWR